MSSLVVEERDGAQALRSSPISGHSAFFSRLGMAKLRIHDPIGVLMGLPRRFARAQ